MLLDLLLMAIRIGLAVLAFMISVSIGRSLRWRWWSIAASSILASAAPVLLLPMTQTAWRWQASWRTWAIHFGIAFLPIVVFLLVGDWLCKHQWVSDTFVAAVYTLSSEAEIIDGRMIHSSTGGSFEITGSWKLAIFLACYGASIGMLFLRSTLNAAIGLAWLGAISGAFLSVYFFAWMIDTGDFESLNTYYYAAFTASNSLPIWLMPWVGLIALKLTKPKGDAVNYSDASSGSPTSTCDQSTGSLETS